MCALKNIRELCRYGMRTAEAGDHSGAQFLLHQALRQAQGLASPVLEAKILNSLGVVCLLRGSGRDAVRHLARALERVERRVGRNNKLYAAIAGNLRRAEEAQAGGA
jgi:Flp pilus assembly protein TadD